MMVIDIKNICDGHKITELGGIPDKWNLVELNQVAKRITTKNKENISMNVLTISAQHGLVSQTDFFKKQVASKNLEGYYLLEKNDFAYNKSYSNGYPMGAIKPLELYDQGVVSPLYICFRFDIALINSEFIKQYFDTNLWHEEVANIAQEGARNHGLLNVSVKEFFNIILILPPLKEQRKIAEILSAADKQKEKTEQLIEKTKELRIGLMQQLLTKGIGHTDFKQTELGEIPIAWKTTDLAEVSSFITKGSTPTTYGFTWQEEGVLFFKSDVVKDGKFVYGNYKYICEDAHEQMKRSQIKAGDLLMTITGNIGRVAVVPKQIDTGNINQHMAKIAIEKNNIIPIFVYYWLSQPKLIEYYTSIKTGLAYPQISLKQVRETLIPVPSLEEQQKIADILSSIDEQIAGYEKEKEKQIELKKALMQKLLTGKIRVTV
jgi:type I restriction enzyme S subunit